MTRPYAANTSVPVARTQVEIEQLLLSAGATQFYRGSDGLAAVVGFEMRNRRIQFALVLPKDARDPEKMARVKWRALLLTIKAKLVSVDAGIEGFEEAFLGQVLIPQNGRAERFATVAIAAIAEAYTGGSMPRLLAGSNP